MTDVPAFDTFVNVTMGSAERPAWLDRVAQDYFKRADSMFRDETVESLSAQMDACNVTRALISVDAHRPELGALAFPEADPERFPVALWVDPTRGMETTRAIAALARDWPVKLVRVVPFMHGLPPNDRAYYPVYAKCIELGLPVSVNTGIPGPPAPGACQHPMHLDDVCLFFPELTLIMAHGADPWWREAIRLMLKYRGLHLMTSAWAPRYLPAELLQYMNTRGRSKVMFASDHPVLSLERCVTEARQLDLRDGVLDAFLHGNAERVLLGRGA